LYDSNISMNFDVEQKGRAPRRRWLCCMYGLMLAEVHQACREPREVGDGAEEDLGSLVHGFAVL